MLPSLDSVDGHSVWEVFSTCYYNSVLVMDGTGPAEINRVKSAQRYKHFLRGIIFKCKARCLGPVRFD